MEYANATKLHRKFGEHWGTHRVSLCEDSTRWLSQRILFAKCLCCELDCGSPPGRLNRWTTAKKMDMPAD
jgi:hypothetical protein